MQEKRTVKLQKNMHLSQMLGFVDQQGNYSVDTETARSLISLQKTEIEQEDKIDIGMNFTNLQSIAAIDGRPVFFRIEVEENKDAQRAVLFLQEEADEMGGLIAFTYLTPLAIFESNDVDTFQNDLLDHFRIDSDGIDNEINISKLDAHAKARRAKHRAMEIEAERLSSSTIRRINRLLPETVKGKLDEIKQSAKRFTRSGKPNYNQAQVQMVKHVIEHNGLQDNQELTPVVQIIEKHEERLETLTQKIFSEELSADIKCAEVDFISTAKQNTEPKHSPRRNATIGKLPAMEQAAIMNSRIDFGKLISRIKRSKHQATHPLKLPKDSEAKRELFKKEYERKAPKVSLVINAAEEVDDKTIEEIAVPETQNTLNVARAATIEGTGNKGQTTQIEQIVAEGLKDFVHKKDEKKSAIAISQKAIKDKKEDEQQATK